MSPSILYTSVKHKARGPESAWKTLWSHWTALMWRSAQILVFLTDFSQFFPTDKDPLPSILHQILCELIKNCNILR